MGNGINGGVKNVYGTNGRDVKFGQNQPVAPHRFCDTLMVKAYSLIRESKQ